MFKFICLVVSLAVSLDSVYAGEDEKPPYHMDLDYNALIEECLKVNGITNADYKDAVMKGDMSTINACFFGCYYKKTGLLNDKGQVDFTNHLTNLKEILKDDSLYAKIKERTEQCESVNDKAVSDGEAGCERAVLLQNCFLGHIIRKETV